MIAFERQQLWFLTTGDNEALSILWSKKDRYVGHTGIMGHKTIFKTIEERYLQCSCVCFSRLKKMAQYHKSLCVAFES